MLSTRYIAVFRKLYCRLRGTNINWVLTGSASFALRGIPVEVHDIDVQTDRLGAYEIEKLFAEYSVQKVTLSGKGSIRSHLGELHIDGIKVEIMGDIQKRLKDGRWEEPVDLNEHKRLLNFEGMKIPVLSLEYEHQAYLKLGRIDKAKIIEKAMKDR